jgi:hypothetical protein
MPEPKKEPEVLIPEVLPPERGSYETPRRPPPRASRVQRFLGPILVGALIDVIDFVTFGPAGFIIGGLAAFWALGRIGVRFPSRFFLALAAGCYCWLPTRHLPVATMVGALSPFFDRER